MNDRDESTDLWAEVVAAVEFLREVDRPGLTVWEVLDEAVRRWTKPEDDDRSSLSWTDPDPLRAAVEMLLLHVGSAFAYGAVPISTVFTAALRDWLEGARHDRNNGKAFGNELLASVRRHGG